MHSKKGGSTSLWPRTSFGSIDGTAASLLGQLLFRVEMESIDASAALDQQLWTIEYTSEFPAPGQDIDEAAAINEIDKIIASAQGKNEVVIRRCNANGMLNAHGMHRLSNNARPYSALTATGARGHRKTAIRNQGTRGALLHADAS